MVRRIRRKQYKRGKKNPEGRVFKSIRLCLDRKRHGKSSYERSKCITIIKQEAGQVDQIAQRGIQQIINQGGQQVEKIAPKIIKSAIEEVYKTPFRLLGRFGKKQLHSIGRKIKKIFRR